MPNNYSLIKEQAIVPEVALLLLSYIRSDHAYQTLSQPRQNLC